MDVDLALLSEGEVSDVYSFSNVILVGKVIEKVKGDFLPFEEQRTILQSRYIDERYEALVRQKIESAKVEINQDVYLLYPAK